MFIPGVTLSGQWLIYEMGLLLLDDEYEHLLNVLDNKNVGLCCIHCSKCTVTVFRIVCVRERLEKGSRMTTTKSLHWSNDANVRVDVHAII